MAVSITVASGKGGVGKTSISVNLALALQRTGAKVCLMDTDFGLANAHIMLGINPAKSISDMLSGKDQLNDIKCKGPNGLNFIAGGSGLNELLNLDSKTRYRIIQATAALQDETDVLLVDAPAGAADSTIAFVSACEKPIIILVGEPTSFMDAYALIKAANLEAGVERFSILVNQSNSEAEAKDHFARFQDIASRFLDVQLNYIGHMPYSQALRKSVVARVPIMASTKESRESIAFQKIAKAIIDAPANTPKGISFLNSPSIKAAS